MQEIESARISFPKKEPEQQVTEDQQDFVDLHPTREAVIRIGPGKYIDRATKQLLKYR